MTMRITVKNADNNNQKRTAKVITVDRFSDGRTVEVPASLSPGESRDFWVHDMRDLRITEGECVQPEPTDAVIARKMYAAYGAVTDHKNFQGNPMPEFDALTEKIKEAWCAAAYCAIEEAQKQAI